jgi:hypothetical protein
VSSKGSELMRQPLQDRGKPVPVLDRPANEQLLEEPVPHLSKSRQGRHPFRSSSETCCSPLSHLAEDVMGRSRDRHPRLCNETILDPGQRSSSHDHDDGLLDRHNCGIDCRDRSSGSSDSIRATTLGAAGSLLDAIGAGG